MPSANWRTGRLAFMVSMVVIVLTLLVPPASAEEEFRVQWSGGDASSPASDLGSNLRIAFVSGLPQGSLVTDAASTPPNPFEGQEFSLYVKASTAEETWFRLEGRPFPDSPPKQGLIEIEFRVNSGNVGMILGSSNLPWISGGRETYSVLQAQLSVGFMPGRPVQIRGRDFQTDSISVIEEAKNYTLLVKWDFEGSPNAPFALYLNGERLTSPVESAAFRIPENPEDAGINAFRVALGSSEDHVGEMFLGRLAAAAVPVDLDSPSGILSKPEENAKR